MNIKNFYSENIDALPLSGRRWLAISESIADELKALNGSTIILPVKENQQSNQLVEVTTEALFDISIPIRIYNTLSDELIKVKQDIDENREFISQRSNPKIIITTKEELGRDNKTRWLTCEINYRMTGVDPVSGRITGQKETRDIYFVIGKTNTLPHKYGLEFYGVQGAYYDLEFNTQQELNTYIKKHKPGKNSKQKINDPNTMNKKDYEVYISRYGQFINIR